MGSRQHRLALGRPADAAGSDLAGGLEPRNPSRRCRRTDGKVFCSSRQCPIAGIVPIQEASAKVQGVRGGHRQRLGNEGSRTLITRHALRINVRGRRCMDAYASTLSLGAAQFQGLLCRVHNLQMPPDADSTAPSRFPRELRLINRFPHKYCEQYLRHHAHGLWTEEVGREPGDWEWLCRAHLVIDFLAGMTDDYAARLQRILVGVSA